MSDADIPTRVALHGVCLDLTSDIERFSTYVRNVMAPHAGSASSDPNIRVHLQWCDTEDDVRRAGPFVDDGFWVRRPDRDLYVARGEARWLRIDDFTSLLLDLRWDGTRLDVRARYRFTMGGKGFTETLRRWRHRSRMDEVRAHRFSTLLYYLVYYPVLWWLSRFEGWSVMHGGAASCRVSSGSRRAGESVSGRTAESAIVLTGMPGCGKSTLVVAMLANPSCNVLSDNLLLYDRARVLSCPEAILLDRSSLDRVGTAAGRLVKTGEQRVYGRDAFYPEEMFSCPVTPCAVFNVERARKTELIEIDAEESTARAFAGNTMAKELRRHLIMNEVLDVVAGTRGPDARADFTELAASIRNFVLAVGSDDSLSDVVSRVVTAALATSSSKGRRVAPA